MFFNVLKSDIKRMLTRIPALLTMTGIFLLFFILIFAVRERLFFDSTEIISASCGIYIPDDSEYNDLALSYIENSESISESVSIIRYKDTESGYAALRDGSIIVLVIIPDNFINSVMDGSNNPIEIIFKGNSSFEEYLVNDLFLSAARMLGTAQASVYSLGDINSATGLPNELNYEYQLKLDTYNFTYALGRLSMFKDNTFDVLVAHSIYETLASAIIIHLLSMSCFIVSDIFITEKNGYSMKMKSLGMTDLHLSISQLISTCLAIYIQFLLIFIVLLFTDFKLRVISLVGILPIVIMIALVILITRKIAGNINYANLFCFILFLAMLYLAGGLIPLQLLPKFLSNMAYMNPMTYVISFTTNILLY